MASGGPSFGFICCKIALVRQIPGRVIGRTEDLEGRVGYALTLQAREQHIRRGKATSNICTNQGLLVTAGTLYMSLLGPAGLRQVACACHDNARRLAEALTSIDGVDLRFDEPFFHEFVLSLPRSSAVVLDALLDEGINGGIPLGTYAKDMDNSLLVCATEKHSRDDIQRYGDVLGGLLA
jgi:glycine dehydrogenase subunit 1